MTILFFGNPLMVNEETDYVKFLTTVNRTIFDNVVRMRSEKNLTLALLDYSDRTLTISGQHEEVLVVRTGGTVEQIDTMDLGFLIGLDTEIADFISQIQIELNPGDAVVLYTDGITEAENLDGEQYGLERLCQIIGENWQLSPEEMRAAAIADLRRHIGEQKVFDDKLSYI
ncbi:PP2C family protein-serine/threonine phosphatase [Oscillatoria acuminata]|uniref:PP2C family protein-serine/threonine phosphatase n=1 Tax=Oscillatoria acuminata TaxID=118323 RepID=UPI0002EBE481|nr:SpoIIE family protein phosphatase [Oscillatoria acuminata]